MVGAEVVAMNAEQMDAHAVASARRSGVEPFSPDSFGVRGGEDRNGCVRVFCGSDLSEAERKRDAYERARARDRLRST